MTPWSIFSHQWACHMRFSGSCPSSQSEFRLLAIGLSLHPNLIVHGDAVGPADANVNQHHSLTAIQPRPLNPWVLAPLSPEQVPGVKVKRGSVPQSMEENRPVARGPGPDQNQEWASSTLLLTPSPGGL